MRRRPLGTICRSRGCCWLRMLDQAAASRLLRSVSVEISVHNVLFLCTGNSARSILAEAYLKAVARSAISSLQRRSHPKGAVHPLTLETLLHAGLKTENCARRAGTNSPGRRAQDGLRHHRLQFAAGEVCPVWPGQPITAHWSFADPARIQGSDDDPGSLPRNLPPNSCRWTFSPTARWRNSTACAVKQELDGIGRS